MKFWDIMSSTNLVVFTMIILVGLFATYYSAHQYYDSVKADIESKELRDTIKLYNEEIIGSVTGGDSYTYLLPFSITQGKSGSFDLNIITEGNFQMYDLSIGIIDYMKFYSPETNKLDETQYRTHASVPYGKAGRTAKLGSYTFDNTNRLEFIAEISARNGIFQQRLKMIFIDDKWLFATRLIKQTRDLKEGKVIFENVGSAFPRMENGEVNWENYNPYTKLN